MRGLVLLAVLGLGATMVAAAPAAAVDAPGLVIPGRPDVPVIINGVDASWCVVEGNWGLDRPGAVSPTVICRTPILPGRGGPKAYYPRNGHAPAVGRLEVRPSANRVLPRPAESFYRVWSIGPEQLPATEYPHFEPPAVMVQPQYPNSSNSRSTPPSSHR